MKHCFDFNLVLGFKCLMVFNTTFINFKVFNVSDFLSHAQNPQPHIDLIMLVNLHISYNEVDKIKLHVQLRYIMTQIKSLTNTYLV